MSKEKSHIVSGDGEIFKCNRGFHAPVTDGNLTIVICAVGIVILKQK